jgi:hypothetical protein
MEDSLGIDEKAALQSSPVDPEELNGLFYRRLAW